MHGQQNIKILFVFIKILLQAQLKFHCTTHWLKCPCIVIFSVWFGLNFSINCYVTMLSINQYSDTSANE